MLPHHLPLFGQPRQTCHGDASMTNIGPNCGMDRNNLGAPVGLGLNARLLCSGNQSLVCECSSLDWVSSAPWTRRHLTHTHTPSTRAVLSHADLQRHARLEPGAISYCSWELLSREKEPSPSGRQEHWEAGIYGRVSEWPQKFGEADKKFWGQIYIQVKTRNAWLVCFKKPWKPAFSRILKWIQVILNRKRNFLKLLQFRDGNLISDLYRKISNAALPTSHFSFPTRKMEKEARERGKKKMTFFQTKENFKLLKIFEQK